MATKKPKSQNPQKKVEVNPPKGSPMEKFHQTMKKIISVPKKDIRNK